MGFAIHWHESVMGEHVSPHPLPSPPHPSGLFQSPSFWVPCFWHGPLLRWLYVRLVLAVTRRLWNLSIGCLRFLTEWWLDSKANVSGEQSRNASWSSLRRHTAWLMLCSVGQIIHNRSWDSGELGISSSSWGESGRILEEYLGWVIFGEYNMCVLVHLGCHSKLPQILIALEWVSPRSRSDEDPRGFWDFSFLSWDFEPRPSAVTTESPNHWIKREFPGLFYKSTNFIWVFCFHDLFASQKPHF